MSPATETITTEPRPQPRPARPVFSTQDFALMKEAVAAYIQTIADDPKSSKFSNLYHRLGRLGG